jgi:hypothetical protein
MTKDVVEVDAKIVPTPWHRTNDVVHGLPAKDELDVRAASTVRATQCRSSDQSSKDS